MMRQPKDQQPNMSTGILIVVLIWALPALAGSFLTCCEQYKSGTDKFWTWGAAGGVLVCLLWPITVPIILVTFLLHNHILIALSGSEDDKAPEEGR